MYIILQILKSFLLSTIRQALEVGIFEADNSVQKTVAFFMTALVKTANDWEEIKKTFLLEFYKTKNIFLRTNYAFERKTDYKVGFLLK